MTDRKILKLTLEEYGYNLSDYITPSNGLEMAILEAMKRSKEQLHKPSCSQNLNVKNTCYKCDGKGCYKFK
jgi:hypothetical protein